MCIPRVFSNIDEKRIRRVFDELNMGEILRVDVISKTTDKGDKFNRVFVHFKRWFANSNSDMARERLLNGKEIKIIYDDPWFWKVSAYREANKPEAPKKISLQFDDDEHKHDSRPRQRQYDNRAPNKDYYKKTHIKKEDSAPSYQPQSPTTPPPSVPPGTPSDENETDSFEEPTAVDYGKISFPKKRRFTLVKPEDLI
jgi:hypothetical protein